jgi:peptidoglycan/LPS O-acetylase OafA/YrhL
MTGETTGGGRGSHRRLRWIRSASMLAMALLLSAVIVDAPDQVLSWVLIGIVFLLMLLIALTVHRWIAHPLRTGRSDLSKKGSGRA